MDNQPNSSIQTGAFTFSTASAVPVVNYIASLYGTTIPTEVSVFMAAAIMSLGHAAYNYLNAKYAKKVTA